MYIYTTPGFGQRLILAPSGLFYCYCKIPVEYKIGPGSLRKKRMRDVEGPFVCPVLSQPTY